MFVELTTACHPDGPAAQDERSRRSAFVTCRQPIPYPSRQPQQQRRHDEAPQPQEADLAEQESRGNIGDEPERHQVQEQLADKRGIDVERLLAKLGEGQEDGPGEIDFDGLECQRTDDEHERRET